MTCTSLIILKYLSFTVDKNIMIVMYTTSRQKRNANPITAHRTAIKLQDGGASLSESTIGRYELNNYKKTLRVFRYRKFDRTVTNLLIENRKRVTRYFAEHTQVYQRP